ncbi:amidohydrolase [Terracidiphilus gabretensis]|uniref:amidohydrolase n=1 Tax=Terracidiphilus gabretensis TaxID=1577687 RepID=UPI00071B2233|nr:amidohydrolase [Terracidiphilus gabretensis]
MRSIRLLLACSALCASFAAAQSAPPDDIYFNGRIYTGAGFAEDKPQTVEAIAIGGGKVLAIGSSDEIKRLAGPKTRLHALDTARTGTIVFPGINDAHTHLGGAGQTKIHLDLTGTHSLSEMQSQIATYAKTSPAGHWITGGNWDHTLWANAVLPTRQDLDKFTGNHPTYLERIDGHIAIANTAALKAASITGKTVPPQGGAIDLDKAGEPTGILRESAKDLLEKIIPPPTQEERRRGDELAIADALSHGVTSVQDFSDWQDFLTFEQLEKEGRLHLRIYEWLPFIAPLDQLKRMRAHHDANDPLLRTGMLKGFMDGSLGSRTAAMKQPFSDDPKNSGLPQFKQDELNKMAVERAEAGFQLGFHAIGDRAASMALDAFTEATIQTSLDYQSQTSLLTPCRAQNQDYQPMDEKMPCAKSSKTPQQSGPQWPLAARNRIEHAQVVDPADIPRFKQLGVIASMQPNHLLTDMNWAESRLGPQRAAYSYAWKAFWDAGVPLAFGTDYPVEPITPFRGLYAAVTRMNEAGTKTYYPENKLTRGQALYAYTQGSAYAEFAEKRKGKLLPGYEADLILVDRDLYTCPASAILKTRVLTTIVAGKQAYPEPSR